MRPRPAYLRIHSTKLNSPHRALKNIIMNSQNYIQISGRLTSDVTPNDKKTYARFSIAHNFLGETEAMFLNCVIYKMEFDRNNQSIPWDILDKGREVLVTGRLTPNVWKDRNGETRKSFEIVVDKIRDNRE